MEKPKNKPIKEWAIDDRPREKMIAKGSETLSNAELFAILLGSGTREKSAVELAREVLESAGNSLKTLSTFSIHELKKINGIGSAKAVTIAATSEIARRREGETQFEKETITSSSYAYKALLPMLRDKTHEEFCVLFLNRKNTVLHKERIGMGDATSTSVNVKRIIKLSLDTNATAIILGHNHPSGNLTPSNSDIEITNRISKAAKLFDIQLFDHLIISQDSYKSLMEEGLLNLV